MPVASVPETMILMQREPSIGKGGHNTHFDRPVSQDTRAGRFCPLTLEMSIVSPHSWWSGSG